MCLNSNNNFTRYDMLPECQRPIEDFRTIHERAMCTGDDAPIPHDDALAIVRLKVDNFGPKPVMHALKHRIGTFENVDDLANWIDTVVSGYQEKCTSNGPCTDCALQVRTNRWYAKHVRSDDIETFCIPVPHGEDVFLGGDATCDGCGDNMGMCNLMEVLEILPLDVLPPDFVRELEKCETEEEITFYECKRCQHHICSACAQKSNYPIA